MLCCVWGRDGGRREDGEEIKKGGREASASKWKTSEKMTHKVLSVNIRITLQAECHF